MRFFRGILEIKSSRIILNFKIFIKSSKTDEKPHQNFVQNLPKNLNNEWISNSLNICDVPLTEQTSSNCKMKKIQKVVSNEHEKKFPSRELKKEENLWMKWGNFFSSFLFFNFTPTPSGISRVRRMSIMKMGKCSVSYSTWGINSSQQYICTIFQFHEFSVSCLLNTFHRFVFLSCLLLLKKSWGKIKDIAIDTYLYLCFMWLKMICWHRYVEDNTKLITFYSPLLTKSIFSIIYLEEGGKNAWKFDLCVP